MDEATTGPPVVSLPERMDRRLRLGPFPSARDALKFLAYAAVGSVIAVSVSSPVGLLVIAGGFGVAIVRVDGEPLDRRALVVSRFLLRLGRFGGTVTPRSLSSLERRGLARGAAGELLAVIRAAGTPMAYLPPVEVTRRFERFRELLRSTDGEILMFGSLAPVRPGPVLPPAGGTEGGEVRAREGYVDLVRRLCDRRRARRVDLILTSTAVGPSGAAELENRVDAILERLSGLDIRAHRLAGRSLLEALARTGSLPGSGPP